MNDKYCIRNLTFDDLYLGYPELLKQLSELDNENLDPDEFDVFVGRVNKNRFHHVFVIEDTEDSTIVGSGTLLIEPKLIHNFGLVGHIEDIVVDQNHQGHGLGRRIIDHLVSTAKNEKCYKVTLYSNENSIEFYKKLGFEKKDQHMAIYF